MPTTGDASDSAPVEPRNGAAAAVTSGAASVTSAHTSSMDRARRGRVATTIGPKLPTAARYHPAVSTSVVVVSHRLHRWMPSCLASVASQCDEIVVVDNGSTGGEVAATARRAGARVVSLPVNAGFPAGVNAGVAVATGDVVAL